MREDKENKKLEYKIMMESKPEFKITVFKNQIKRDGFGKNIKTDMEVLFHKLLILKLDMEGYILNIENLTQMKKIGVISYMNSRILENRCFIR